MTEHKNTATLDINNDKQPAQHGQLSAKLPSSAGDSSRNTTAKDATPGDAAWSDRQQRHLSSGTETQREEAMIDEAIDLTFPASDPVAEFSASAASEKTQAFHDEDEVMLDEAIEMTFPASDPISFTPQDKVVKPRTKEKATLQRA